jgi:hypothetical protein
MQADRRKQLADLPFRTQLKERPLITQNIAPLYLPPRSTTLRKAADGEVLADLEKATHAKLLSDLRQAQGFDLQIFALDTENEVAHSQRTMASTRLKSKVVLRIFAIVYGPLSAYKAVGVYIGRFGLNLQDPIFCDRNVEYHNPQRLRRVGKPVLYTHSLGSAQMCTSVEEFGASACDLFALLEGEKNYAETDAPHALSTNLYQYLPPACAASVPSANTF